VKIQYPRELQIARSARPTTAETPSARGPAPSPASAASAVRGNIEDIRDVAVVRRRSIPPVGQLIGSPQSAIDTGEPIGHGSAEGGCTQSAHTLVPWQPAPPPADASESVPESGPDKGRDTAAAAAAESQAADPQALLARVIRQGRRRIGGRSSDVEERSSSVRRRRGRAFRGIVKAAAS